MLDNIKLLNRLKKMSNFLISKHNRSSILKQKNHQKNSKIIHKDCKLKSLRKKQ